MRLGSEVKDNVSGFQGIAVAKHIYLQGCTRVTVQPVVDKAGKLPDAQTFDEPQLKVLRECVHKRQAETSDPGGPEKYTDPGR